ncbi:hypothetical protein UP17_18365 [Peribacillus simplex]|nr:hypothetical protein UP17_18365 [Peribacillus simplex]
MRKGYLAKHHAIPILLAYVPDTFKESFPCRYSYNEHNLWTFFVYWFYKPLISKAKGGYDHDKD